MSMAFAKKYDQSMLAGRRMRALYGESGYFNVGYWVQGTTELATACDRLVDEVAAAVPQDAAALIIDAGCGLGAGTRRLADRFSPALVLGANISLEQLTAARGRGVPALVVMDAARMAIGTGAADAVISIEAALHFDTRATFFAEAYRVLRPGGVLSVADMLFNDVDAIGAWMIPPENRIATIPEYETMLGNAGFIDVTVRDVTADSWHPFCLAMRGVFNGHDDALRAIKESVAHYIFASARVPDGLRSRRAARSGMAERPK
jgi:SAM-dependent methyltransferase